MNIPSNFKPLLCAKCNIYLSRQPVMILEDGRSVCGQCSCQTNARNLAYESLAQLMIFPCRYVSNGCKKMLPWNTSAVHEDVCQFNNVSYENVYDSVVEIQDHCSVCQMNIYIVPRYECLQGHKICPKCTNINIQWCPLCKEKIPNEIIYLCKYWTFGCKRKATKDVIKRHETDCYMRHYKCPFGIDDCNWSGGLYDMSNHLKTTHEKQIVESDEVTRTFRMKDDSWVMLAHDEIFRCVAWKVDDSIEWFAQYVGPQERCCLFVCMVRLYSNTTQSILKMTNTCHGWNNVALEKCITVKLTDVTKYITNREIQFKFKILKKQFPVL